MMLYLAVVGFFVASISVAAQENQSAERFEVASVKPSAFRAGDQYLSNTGIVSPGGRWSALNTTVSQLVRTLYGVRAEQIVGAPPWFDRDLFVIDARAADPNVSREQVIEMAKQLLAERFGLRFHIEQRALDMHVLVLARPNGEPGPGLRPTTCEMLPTENRTSGSGPLPPNPAGQRPYCRTFYRDVIDGLWKFRMYGHTLRTLLLLHRVEFMLGASVLDRTGLTGLFDIEIEYVPDPQSAASGSAGPPVFAAMEDQLGLKIERRSEVVDVLVIDSVNHPSPD